MNSKKRIDWRQVLKKAADAGRKSILDNYNASTRREVTKKGAGGDLTLRIDEASEEAIHRSLIHDLGNESFVFVSEEIGEVAPEDEYGKPIVVCDPLDGSHNAQVGIPLFSISLSVMGINKKMSRSVPRRFEDVDVSLIRSVLSDDEFFAMKGKGACHNERRLLPRRNLPKQIETLLVECGDLDYLKELLASVRSSLVYKTRILGSAALGFAYLANGTSDAFIFAQPGGARTIDSPAGYLIATEAGCCFSNLGGQEKLAKIEVGFHSKVNLIGASNRRVLSLLWHSFRAK